MLPPCCMTSAFRISVLTSIAGSITCFTRWRINGIKDQKEILERQVQERTERLAQSTERERKARLEAEKARTDAENAQHDAEKARLEAEKANQAKSVFLAT